MPDYDYGYEYYGYGYTENRKLGQITVMQDIHSNYYQYEQTRDKKLIIH